MFVSFILSEASTVCLSFKKWIKRTKYKIQLKGIWIILPKSMFGTKSKYLLLHFSYSAQE